MRHNRYTIMKTSSLLIASALLAPASILVGLAAPVALSITAVAGVLSVALSDYGTRGPTYFESVRVAAGAEKLPMAA